MAEVIVRDKNNMAIGVVRDDGSQLTATNYKRGYAGYYSKNIDQTFDKNGRPYCFGDGTQSLVRDLENER